MTTSGSSTVAFSAKACAISRRQCAESAYLARTRASMRASSIRKVGWEDRPSAARSTPGPWGPRASWHDASTCPGPRSSSMSGVAAAPYTLAFTKQNPGLQAGNDPRFSQKLRRDGPAIRRRCRNEWPCRRQIQGNAITTDWPGAQDDILMSYVWSAVGGDDILTLATPRAYDALRPGGLVLVHDFMVDDRHEGPALYSTCLHGICSRRSPTIRRPNAATLLASSRTPTCATRGFVVEPAGNGLRRDHTVDPSASPLDGRCPGAEAFFRPWPAPDRDRPGCRRCARCRSTAEHSPASRQSWPALRQRAASASSRPGWMKWAAGVADGTARRDGYLQRVDELPPRVLSTLEFETEQAAVAAREVRVGPLPGLPWSSPKDGSPW